MISLNNVMGIIIGIKPKLAGVLSRELEFNTMAEALRLMLIIVCFYYQKINKSHEILTETRSHAVIAEGKWSVDTVVPCITSPFNKDAYIGSFRSETWN